MAKANRAFVFGKGYSFVLSKGCSFASSNGCSSVSCNGCSSASSKGRSSASSKGYSSASSNGRSFASSKGCSSASSNGRSFASSKGCSSVSSNGRSFAFGKNLFSSLGICCLFFISFLSIAVSLSSCGNKSGVGVSSSGDTIRYRYATLLTRIAHDRYDEIIINDPWKKGHVLHKYCLVKRADSAQVGNLPVGSDVVYLPVNRAVVATAPLCQLMLWLQAPTVIKGVCDAEYVNIAELQKLIAQGTITSCGSSMAPSLEQMAVLHPQALFMSSYENGSFSMLKRLKAPVIECVEYMEPNALARAEWMKFYGLLIGKERQADSLFTQVEKSYKNLVALAAKAKQRPMVLTERVTGGTWYCPGGASSMATLLSDANARYVFAHDTHSGSLSLAPEAVVAAAHDADVWLFTYLGPRPLSKQQLLAEYHGYANIKAFRNAKIYQCSSERSTYFNEVSFHPDFLLADMIKIFHPDIISHPDMISRPDIIKISHLNLGRKGNFSRYYDVFTASDRDFQIEVQHSAVILKP